MLEKVKVALRIKNNSKDINDDINDLIEAAKLDLKTSGVRKVNIDDPLIIQAIKTYCKANFGLDNKDSVKYQEAYELQKEKLCLCGEYNVE